MTWNKQGRREMHTEFCLGKPEGKRPTGSPTCRLGNYIKLYLNGIEWETVWILRIRLTIGTDGRLL